MSGAPRLDAVNRNRYIIRDVLEILVGIFHFDIWSDFGYDCFFKCFLMFFFNDQNDFLEAGFDGIKDCEFNDRFVVISDTIDLLKSSVAGTHSGSQNDESFFHCKSS